MGVLVFVLALGSYAVPAVGPADAAPGLISVVVHAFEPPPARAPRAPLLRTTDGSFYGTLSEGGPGGHGALFQFFPIRGAVRLVHVFGGADGSRPSAALVEGGGGVLYGTTSAGGPNGRGTVFRFDRASATLSSLHEFDAALGFPQGGVVLAPDGRLYGVAGSGFTTVLYRYDLAAALFEVAATYSIGGRPTAPPIVGADGKLYGVGGCSNSGGGGIYSFDPTSSTATVLRTFAQATGTFPCAPLFQAADGRLYGTTTRGGGFDRGVLFRFDPGTLAYSVLHDFDPPTDGLWPLGGVLEAADGTIHGTTSSGVNAPGTLFRYDPATSVFLVVHRFGGASGYSPEAALIDAGDGTLLGTTSSAGVSAFPDPGAGTIYRYRPATASVETAYRFGNAGGSTPQADLMVGPDGALFGTTTLGGAGGEGTLFRFDTATRTLTTLHGFDGGFGARPVGGVVTGADGALYGTAPVGGTFGAGTLFRFDATTTGLASLHHFTGESPDYGVPKGRLLLRPDASLWGTTEGRWLSGGSVFRYEPATGSTTTIASFSREEGPVAGLTEAGGRIHGSTASEQLGGGHVNMWFSIDPATLTLTPFGPLGSMFRPLAAVTEADGGVYLPLAAWSNQGRVVRRDLVTGQATTPVAFTGQDGDTPRAALVVGPDGALYGTTELGGDFGFGTVYRFQPGATGHTVIHHFRGTDGAHPRAGVVFGTDGALYGTTADGGPLGGGTIYRLFRWRR